MASTFSPTLRLELIGDGDQSGIWGQTTNSNLGTLIEQAITGVQTVTMSDANYTLTSFNGVADEARNAILEFTGTLSQQRNVIAPLVEKTYVIKNSTTGGFPIQIIGASGTGVVIQNGTTTAVYCNGTNFFSAFTGTAGNFTINGNATVTGSLNIVGASNVVPAGSLLMWPTGSAPSGYLLCNGNAVSRSTYSALFAVIGTTFGPGDGSTTFNLPDYRNRMPVGAGAAYAVGSTGGSPDAIVVAHTHTFSGTTGNMNSNVTHSHGVADPGHRHIFGADDQVASQGGYDIVAGFEYDATSRTGGAGVQLLTKNTSLQNAGQATGISINNADINHTHNFSGTTASTGSSGTNANLPPYLGINFVIKF